MPVYGNPDSIRSAPDQVLYEPDHERGIAEIILNRPEKRNALSVPMRYRIADLIHAAERDDGINVILLRGNGPSFCSGNEINEDWGQRQPGKRRYTLTDAIRYGTDMTWGRQGFTQAISRCSKITILEMHGYCAAAAYFMIATKCDLVITAADAKIGAVEGRFLGPAGAVSSVHINRILGTKAARRLGYTAEPMSGREAFDLGLAHACVDEATLHETAIGIAAQLAMRPAGMMQYLKARCRFGEAALGASVPAVTGLLFSHFLKGEQDELDFWGAVRRGGVGSALDADKSRRDASAGRGGEG
jgi:enoyl-CoA hydratase/carnithine racemase